MGSSGRGGSWSDGYDRAVSVLRSEDLDTCVRCGLCLQACPTYGLTAMEGYGPRGRIATARSLLEPEDEPSPVVAEYMDTCLGCRACEAVCPSSVPYGRILEGARAELPPSGGPGRRLIERLLLWVVAKRWRLSMASVPLLLAGRVGPLRLAAWLARRGLAPRGLANVAGLPRMRVADLATRVGTNYEADEDVRERGQVVLFTGCVQDAWFREVHWATIAALTGLGYRVRVPHGQVCCGALHAHAGRDGAARKLARRNLGPLAEFSGEIVVNAAGCGAKLREYEEVLGEDGASVAGRVRDVTEIMRPEELRAAGASPPAGLERVAVQDACHLRFAQGIVDEPRWLLEAAGYEVIEPGDEGRCCGAAGTYALHHPEWARPLRDEKLEALRGVAPDAVATGNPGCQLWLAGAPDAPPVYHTVQLLAMALVHGREQWPTGPSWRT